MQPGSSTVACFLDLHSSFNVTLTPNASTTSKMKHPASEQQQRMSPFDAAPSSISYSPPLTPPSLELLKIGMRDVPSWLKSLRLHKYTSLFAELSYEDMMKLDEEELEKRKVTKGARKKILQSIQKLCSRSADLRKMHERLSLTHPQGCLRCVIASLRQMMTTPMIPYIPAPGENSDNVHGFTCVSNIHDQNVPGLIFNVLREVQQAVFVSSRQPLDLEYDYLLMLFAIYDRICNSEAFTSAQKQRVLQWKRLARKAIRPADVRRQRIGIPHSGKCELCHYKDLSYRDNGKMNNKPNVGSSERISCQLQQHRFADAQITNHFSLAGVVLNPFLSTSVPVSHYGVDQYIVRQWPPTFILDNNHQNNVNLRNRTRRMLPLNAEVITQTVPQYRSQQRFVPVETSIPLLSGSSQSHEVPSRWPRSIYENRELLARDNAGRIQLNKLLSQPSSLWDSLSPSCPPVERSGDTTSGYSSSTSDRSSGAGSPRACDFGQTLYDRVCRELAALQLSI
ncbi:hypothetical protein RB195_012931 [Necator americanus]|uniref:SAM domain-containing protein n=1 Tax=Necator americanus TaxID=51031 RepID=A0ABR1DTH3_NECAM